jgi:hypothetical protein
MSYMELSDQKSLANSLSHTIPDPGAFNAAGIVKITDHFKQWRTQVEPDRSIVLLDTTTVRNAFNCLQSEHLDIVDLFDLNTVCTAFIFYDRVVFQDAEAVNSLDFGPLSVKSMQYNTKFAQEHLNRLWQDGQEMLREINSLARIMHGGCRSCAIS